MQRLSLQLNRNDLFDHEQIAADAWIKAAFTDEAHGLTDKAIERYRSIRLQHRQQSSLGSHDGITAIGKSLHNSGPVQLGSD